MSVMELQPTQSETEYLNVDLMHRRENGIEVFLMWHREHNVLSIMLTDLQSNEAYNFIVPNDKGLDAFAHPFAYLGET